MLLEIEVSLFTEVFLLTVFDKLVAEYFLLLVPIDDKGGTFFLGFLKILSIFGGGCKGGFILICLDDAGLRRCPI